MNDKYSMHRTILYTQPLKKIIKKSVTITFSIHLKNNSQNASKLKARGNKVRVILESKII